MILSNDVDCAKLKGLWTYFKRWLLGYNSPVGKKNCIHNLSPYFKRWRLRYISSMGNSIFKTVSIIHFVFLWTYKVLLCLLHEYTKTLEMYCYSNFSPKIVLELSFGPRILNFQNKLPSNSLSRLVGRSFW